MRRFIAGIVLVASFASGVATSAGASTATHSPSFVGRFRVTAFGPNGPEFHTTWHIRADGTVTDHRQVARWSNHGDTFTLVAEAGALTFVWTGTRTAHGISRLRKPGTITENGGQTGSWFARKLPGN